MFRLEPHIENGRGKSPYDPKLLTASMLIGEFKTGYTLLLSCVLQQGHIKNMGVLKTPSAFLFHFSRYIGWKVNVNNRSGHSCHSL